MPRPTEDDTEPAAHTMADAFRNAIISGFSNLRPVLALLEIAAEEDIYPAQLETRLGMDYAACHALTRKLKAKGFVTDRRHPETRSRCFQITEAGQTVVDFICEGGEAPDAG